MARRRTSKKTWGGRGKNGARSSVVSLAKPKAAKAALFFPGHSCLCVEEARRQGTIDKDTFIVVVERDPAIAKVIRRKMRNFDYHLHVGEVTTMDLSSVLGRRRINFAFFDFCGQLTSEIASWISKQTDVFAKGAHVAFTFSMSVWSNKFLRQAEEELGAGRYSQLQRRVARQLHRRARFIQGSTNRFRDLVIRMTFASLASFCHTHIEACDEYCDTSPMIMLRFRITQRDDISTGGYYQRLLGKCVWERKKELVEAGQIGQPQWKELGCPDNMTPGHKAARVRAAAAGQRPPWLRPGVWARHPMNPKGTRQQKVRRAEQRARDEAIV